MKDRIDIKEIIVSEEYEKLVPRMNLDDDRKFEESVKQNGIQEPLTLNQDRLLLDGHSRYRKAIKLEMKQLPFRIKQFTDKLLEKKYVIECNLARRHLTPFQKIELGYPLIEIEQQLAKQRQLAHLKNQKKDDNTLRSDDPNEKGRTAEIISKQIGVSDTMFKRGRVIIDQAPENIKQKLREGRITINSAYNHITRKERNIAQIVPLPVGKWSVVVVDLPIGFDDAGVRGSSGNNYTTMSIEECYSGIINGKDVRGLFADNCVIFAWFQASTIFDARNILESWGFHCVTNRIWDKERIGTGSWLANRHEHIVIAVKGTMPLPAERLESLFRFKPETRLHSEKPIIFYDDVEKMYPQNKYLDLFSRYQHNENWTCFGNQAPIIREHDALEINESICTIDPRLTQEEIDDAEAVFVKFPDCEKCNPNGKVIILPVETPIPKEKVTCSQLDD